MLIVCILEFGAYMKYYVRFWCLNDICPSSYVNYPPIFLSLPIVCPLFKAN